ncbi:DUF3347 domain-containing protein [Flavobacterium glaciei]|uniref:Uncharacterized protein DUF3347 n=1 Tax=Flavobacterium glaciei TaxID=386300 RepID=A0A562PRW1_9FLAO|nr:DUF3347 domain-containing protein [Flavobacterium glaciei]RDI54804.1 uncharacterized protein DUF3347 [Flavobacterium glaciei]TWI47128.1 uncharacterized protein DUF3347 [Flavobacterium glaciei]
MKKILFLTLIATVLTVSCNQKNKDKSILNSEKTEKTTELFSCPMHSEITGIADSDCPECGMELTEKVMPTTLTEKKATSISGADDKEEPTTMVKTRNADKATFQTDAIASQYLKIKNALTKDDSKEAAAEAKKLITTLDNSVSSSLDAKLKNTYNGFVADAKAHVKHISDNAGNMEHQRDYFSLLSKDVYGLIKTFGTKQTVYQDYCPMFGDGKTGYWITETKEVINPYYGSEMLNCGKLVQTFL